MNSVAWVCTGGEGPTNDFDLRSLPGPSCICAADSGVDLALSLGLKPDFAIGDFDSIVDVASLSEITYDMYPTDKDYTDTELLLIHIKQQNLPYILLGGGGRRFDHLLHMYSLFESYGPPLHWITCREHMLLVENSISLPLRFNTTVSIVPALISGKSSVTSNNLVWDVKDYEISSSSMSISNKVLIPPITLHVEGTPVFLSIVSTLC